MSATIVALPPATRLERLLERRVLERLNPSSAIAADEVVVMVAARVHALEARDSVAEIHALDEAEVVQPFESSIDAGDPDPWPVREPCRGSPARTDSSPAGLGTRRRRGVRRHFVRSRSAYA